MGNNNLKRHERCWYISFLLLYLACIELNVKGWSCFCNSLVPASQLLVYEIKWKGNYVGSAILVYESTCRCCPCWLWPWIPWLLHSWQQLWKSMRWERWEMIDGLAVLSAEIEEMPDIGLTCQYYNIWNLYLRSRSIYCCTCWVAYSRGGQEKMESHVFTHSTRLYWTGAWLLAMEVLCIFAPGQGLIRWPCLQEKFMLSGILHSVQISM